jgi:hypothetical protein
MNTTTCLSGIMDRSDWRVFGVNRNDNCRIVATPAQGAAKWSVIFDQPGDGHQASEVTYGSPGEALTAIENTCGWQRVGSCRLQ